MNTIETGTLNPGQYIRKGCGAYSVAAYRTFEGGRLQHVQLDVNAQSAAHAKQLAERAGYTVTSGARLIERYRD